MIVNDKAEQILTQLLERAVSGMEEAVEFSQAQIPEVIEQLLMWKFWESLIFTLIPLVFLMFFVSLFVVAARRAFKAKGLDNETPQYKFWWNADGLSGIGFVVLFLLTICSLFSFIALVRETDLVWLQIAIAPKLYLLEYASSLVN